MLPDKNHVMWSKHLHHIIGFSSKPFFSNSAINKIVNVAVNFVPIAVPRNCFKVLSSNSKIFFKKLF